MKKTSKKALSLLLALVMLLTSLSAGFAALAASTDQYQALATALKADGVQNAAWPGSASNYTVTMNDPTGDIEKAAEAFWSIVQSDARNYTNSGRGANGNLQSLRNAVAAQLQNGQYGLTPSELAVANSALNAFTAFQGGAHEEHSGFWSTPDQPQARTYYFNLTRAGVADRLLAYADVDDVPDTLYGGVQYSYYHQTNTAESGFGGYDRYRWISLNSWNRVETAADTATPAALKAFDAFVSDHLDDDLDAMEPEALAQLCTDMQAQIDAMDAVGLWGNDTVINHFFDKEAIEVFYANAQTARDTAYATDYATQIKDLMDANDPAVLEHDALTALHSDLIALRTSLLGCTADAQAAGLEAAGTTMDAINAYIDLVNEEIEVDDLTGYKATVDAVIDTVPDLAAATDDALLAALAQAQTQWALISACTPGAIERVFPEGTGYVTDFIYNVQVEVDARALADDVAGFGAYFATKLVTDLTTLDTTTLLSWRTDDRAQFEALSAYEEEAVDRVYGDGYFASVAAYIDSIDSTLQARVEAQIDEAVDNYNEYGQITILNYKDVQAAIGGVETAIIDTIGLTDAYQQKYDTFAAMLDEYNEFVATNGASGWLDAPDVDYPTRTTPMAGDMARTADEAYDVTSDKLQTVIDALDGLMHEQDFSDLLSMDQVISQLIKGALQDNLYTDAMVNTLVTTVYGMLVETLNGVDLGSTVNTLLSVLGYDTVVDVALELDIALYPKDVAGYLSDQYPQAKAAMQAAGTNWDAFDMNTTWGVTDQNSFVMAVSYSLCGIQNVLSAVLTNKALTGGIKIVGGLGSADARIEPMNLYNNEILPLLELLGCENLTPTSTYNTYQWSQDLLPPILNPLLDWVNKLADQPITYVLDLLPKLAYMMEFDMIGTHLRGIQLNGSVKVEALWGIIEAYEMDIGQTVTDALGANNLYGILAAVLADTLDISVLNDINKLLPMILGMVAPDATLALPTIDQAYLASLGTMNLGVSSVRSSGTRNEYVSDRPATLLALLRYVLPMLGDKDFMDSLLALIGQLTGSEIALSDDIMGILQGLGNDPDNVICALTELFVPQTYASKELNYLKTPVPSYDEEGNPILDEQGEPVLVNQAINEVTYSEDWTKDQAQFIADNLDDFINNMMIILGGADMPTLDKMIQSFIYDQFYTNETINSVIALVMDQIASIGIDTETLVSLVNTLVGVDLQPWVNAYNTPNYDWGVQPGDPVTFKESLKDALSPFAPILATLMSGEKDLTILGTVTMKSYPGYQNGIIPILEALGCEDIVSAADFALLCQGGEENYEAIIGAIIDPLLGLVDRVANDPVNTLLDILPNALYFISCGNLQIAVENALQSAFVLLDTIRPIYNLSFDLNLDLQSIVLDLLANLEVNGQKLNLKIPFLSDFTQLCVGTVAEYESASGKTAYKLVDVDRADFVTVLMRNIVDLIFYQDNINAIVDLVGSYANMSDENKATLAEILGTFAEMYKENNGVDKILNAVYVIYKGVYDAGEGAISGLGDLNDRWSAVFEMLYNSGNPVLEELAKTADKLLDWLTFGFITGEGIGTAGLIDFFDRLSAFFTGRVTDVSISQTEADMYEGTTMTLSLSFKPVTVKNTNAAWTTSDPSIATVENGFVTAVGPGDAEITATTEDGGLVVSCVVRVRADKTALNEAIAFVESTELTEEQAAAIETTLNAAKYVQGRELATQDDVDSVTTALLDALKSLDLGGSIESVVITQNGEAVGQVVYQQVKWYNRWNSTPVELGIQINEGANVRSITWSYANWSVDDPEADIEASEDGMTALIRAKNSVVGAHSCWIQVTVEDVYGNKVTSDPVKVRFYNYDWQK